MIQVLIMKYILFYLMTNPFPYYLTHSIIWTVCLPYSVNITQMKDSKHSVISWISLAAHIWLLPPVKAEHLYRVAPWHLTECVQLGSVPRCLCQIVCALSVLSRIGPEGFGCPESDLRYGSYTCEAQCRLSDEAALWVFCSSLKSWLCMWQ